MIYIDPRAGSKPLYSPLKKLSLPVRLEEMKYGDIAFQGNGPGGPHRIGIEFKRLDDLLACIVDKRLVSHQLPGLVRHYSRPMLLIEGIVRPAPDSGIETFITFTSKSGSQLGKFQRVYSAITYPQFCRYLLTLSIRCGLPVHFTSTRADTLGYISALYHWYQKPWEKHHAHLALLDREDSSPRDLPEMFRRPSVFRRIISCLPGIGWTRSKAVAAKFQSLPELVDSEEKDWTSIPGIGVKTAQAVHKAIHRRYIEEK